MTVSLETRKKMSEARKTSSNNWIAGSSKLVALGISAEIVKQRRDAGFRFCRGHNAFLPFEAFLQQDNTYLCRLCRQDRTAHRKYGTPLGWYRQKFEAQNGKCRLCDQPSQGRVQMLCVDHDHSCCPGESSCGECVRGLLCNHCNLLLQVLDNPEWLRKAQLYKEGACS